MGMNTVLWLVESCETFCDVYQFELPGENILQDEP